MRKRSLRKSLVTVLGVAVIGMCAGPAMALADSTTGSSATGNVAGFGAGFSSGQTFTVPNTVPADTFFHSLTINGFQSSGGTSHIFITATSAGLPTTVLFTSPAIPATAGPVPLTVYPNITVTTGTQYAFTMEPDAIAGGVAPVSSTSGGAYTGGTVVFKTWMGTWGAVNTQDIAFLASFNSGAHDTLTTLSCPGPGKIGQTIACTATVDDAGSGTGQSGLAVAPSNLNGGSFPGPPCVTDGSGNCSVNFTPTNSGADTIFAQFIGDGTHLASNGSTGLTVNKRNSAQTAAGCTPTTLHVGETATCFVTVSDTDTGTKTTPSGAASFSSTGAGTFAGGGACALAQQSLGVSKCAAITYTPTSPGTHSIASAYGGDGTHTASTNAAAGTLTVLPAPVASVDCSGVLAKIASVKKKLRKASGAKKKKLKKKLKGLRGQAAALGC
jgi:hypothetical protein